MEADLNKIDSTLVDLVCFWLRCLFCSRWFRHTRMFTVLLGAMRSCGRFISQQTCARHFSFIGWGKTSEMPCLSLWRFWGARMESSAHGWSRPFSERIPSSEHIPGKFRANSGQIPSKHPKSLSFLATLCNEFPWLEHRSSSGETDDARNLASKKKNTGHQNTKRKIPRDRLGICW